MEDRGGQWRIVEDSGGQGRTVQINQSPLRNNIYSQLNKTINDICSALPSNSSYYSHISFSFGRFSSQFWNA